MFYHWLAPLGKTYIIFNLFNYISFRAAGATVTALLLAFIVGPPVIARLRARKVGQVIRAEGPVSHQTKRGTPTMGGLIIILATIVPTLLWAPLTNRFVIVAMLSTLWMGVHRFPRRLPQDRPGKVSGAGGAVEAGGAGELRIAARALPHISPIGAEATRFPPRRRHCRSSSTSWSTSLPGSTWCSLPWSSRAASNAVNLTDGLDGLAAGLAAIACGGLRDLRLSDRPRGRDGLPRPVLSARRRRARRLLRGAHGRA